ncbi:flavin reductase family protein [Clostridiaceae bacterium M8S5]|nr:flavin reductase family protein [Clostridiaceae bacterium M8S5]
MKKTHNELIDGIKALPPFPVVFVTVGKNIMVAGAFHFFSYNPPSVMVGIKPEKYTYELIKSMKEFAINIPSKEQLDSIKICGSLSGRKEDNKYERAGLTHKQGNKINSYIVNECSVNLECEVVHEIDFDGSHKWFIGEIKQVHVDENYRRSDTLMFWLGQFREVGALIEGRKDEDIFL